MNFIKPLNLNFTNLFSFEFYKAVKIWIFQNRYILNVRKTLNFKFLKITEIVKNVKLILRLILPQISCPFNFLTEYSIEECFCMISKRRRRRKSHWEMKWNGKMRRKKNWVKEEREKNMNEQHCCLCINFCFYPPIICDSMNEKKKNIKLFAAFLKAQKISQ